MGIVKLRPLLISVAVPMALGYMVSLATSNAQAYYSALELPNFAPASSVFSIVWPILYFLMGLAFYKIWITPAPSELRYRAKALYFIQLAVNLLYPIVFFKLGMNKLGLLLTVILVVLNLALIPTYYKINKTAAVLMLPYLLWIIFAMFLMISIVRLNS